MPLKFILSNNVLKYALIATASHYLASFVFTLLVAMHLQLVVGYSAATTGLFLVAQPFVMVLSSTCSGRLSHMFGPQALTISGIILCIIGATILLRMDATSSLILILVAQMFLGIGFGLFTAPNTIIVMSSVQPRHFALASALLSIARTVGQALSMAILTALFHYTIDAEAGTARYVAELSDSIHLTIIISLATYAITLSSCLLCLKSRRAVVKARRAAPKEQ